MPVEAAIPEPAAVATEAPPVEAVIAEPAVAVGVSTAKDLHENVRKIAEQSLERSRNAYDQMRAVADEATGSFESSYTAATKGLGEFNAKALDALKINTDATFDLMKALMGVKTLSEAITLQTEHVRKQFDAMTAQGKELAEIAKKVASETTEPLKAGVAKTLGKAA
jgi:phasin